MKVLVVHDKNDAIHYNNLLFVMITLGRYWPARESNSREKIVAITRLMS